MRAHGCGQGFKGPPGLSQKRWFMSRVAHTRASQAGQGSAVLAPAATTYRNF